MININNYMNDGANYQAQAVMVLIRGLKYKVEEDWYWYDEVLDILNAKIEIGRFENCREQGYVISVINNGEQIVHYAFFEHRNSDKIVIFKFYGSYLNTPLINDVYGERGKYDYDKSFDFGKVFECAEWIIEDIIKELKTIY